MYHHKTIGATGTVFHVLPKCLTAAVHKYLKFVRGEAEDKDSVFATMLTLQNAAGGKLQNLQDSLDFFCQETGGQVS